MKTFKNRYTGLVQIIVMPEFRPLKSEYNIRKVNQKHISKLMWRILNCLRSADGIIERGELVAALYDIGGRRYCGYYVEPCFSKNKSQKYNRCYKRAQAAMSRCLYRLESRGFVRLIRYRKYVKKIELTTEGKIFINTPNGRILST